MSFSTRLHTFYNVDAQRFCDSDGSPLAIEQLPRITLEQQAVLALTCIHDDGRPASFHESDTFSWAADDDWDSASTVLLYSPNEAINNPDQWPDAAPAAGRLAILIDAASASLREALGSREEMTIYGELKVYAAGATRPFYVGQMVLRARNLIDHSGMLPPPLPAMHYNRAEVDSLIAGRLPLAGGSLTGKLEMNGHGIVDVGLLAPAASTEVAIVDGVAVLTQSRHRLSPESGTADELFTLEAPAGIYWLTVTDGASITLKGTGGNLVIDGNRDLLFGTGALQVDHDGVTARLVTGSAGAGLPVTVSQAEAEAGSLTEARLWTPERVGQAIAALESGEPNPVIATQTEAEAGTLTEPRLWTPERVKQAIAALANGGGTERVASLTVGGELGSALLSDLEIVAGERYLLEVAGWTDGSTAHEFLQWDDGAGSIWNANYLVSHASGYTQNTGAVELTSSAHAGGWIKFEIQLAFCAATQQLQVTTLCGAAGVGAYHNIGTQSGVNNPSRVTKLLVSRSSGWFKVGTVFNLYRHYRP